MNQKNRSSVVITTNRSFFMSGTTTLLSFLFEFEVPSRGSLGVSGLLNPRHF